MNYEKNKKMNAIETESIGTVLILEIDLIVAAWNEIHLFSLHNHHFINLFPFFFNHPLSGEIEESHKVAIVPSYIPTQHKTVLMPS